MNPHTEAVNIYLACLRHYSQVQDMAYRRARDAQGFPQPLPPEAMRRIEDAARAVAVAMKAVIA